MDLSVDAVFAVAAFVFGAVVGSFINVVIARVPHGESVVYPASRCPSCGSSIRFYDNIPIISFLFLGGRCRDCGDRISPRYPLVEFASACLCVSLYLKYGISPAFAVLFAFSAAMLAVFVIDMDHMIIPDVISLNGIPIGIIASIVGFLPDMNWKLSLVGTFLGGAVLYVPAVIYERIRGLEGLGGGDIKLLAMIGSFTGVYGVVFVLFLSSLVGSVCALVGMTVKGAGPQTPIPFGPFLATAGVVYIFTGKLVIDQFYLLSAVF